MIGRPHWKRSTPIGKFWMDRCVCAAQYTSAGTSMGPIESFSVLVLVMASIGTPCRVSSIWQDALARAR